MLCSILNKIGKQHSTKQQLYGHLPPISQTIHVRQTRCVGHCWRSNDEITSDALPWTPTFIHTKYGSYINTPISIFL